MKSISKLPIRILVILFFNLGLAANANFGKVDRVGDRLSRNAPDSYKQLKIRKEFCEDSKTLLKRRVQIVGREGKLLAFSEIFDVTHLGHYLNKFPCYHEYARILEISGNNVEVKIDSSQTRKAFDYMGSWTHGIIFVYDQKLDDWIAVADDSSSNNFFNEGSVEDLTVPLRIYEPLLVFEGQDNAQMLSRLDDTLTELNRGFSSEGCSITISKRGPIHFGGRPAEVFKVQDPVLPNLTLTVKKVASAINVKFYEERAPNFYEKTVSFDDVLEKAKLYETGVLSRGLCTIENAQEREIYRAHIRELIKTLALERRELSILSQSADEKRLAEISNQIKILDAKIYELKDEEYNGVQKLKYF